MGTYYALCGYRFAVAVLVARLHFQRLAVESITGKYFTWTMSGMLAIGSLLLWLSSADSLIYQGGFQGIALWQMAGIFLLFYQRNRLRAALLTLSKADGWKYWVNWFNLKIVQGNILANTGTIAIIITNLLLGRLEWSGVETFGLLIGFVIAGLTVVSAIESSGPIMQNQAALFWVAVASRAIPQMLIALSPQVNAIPSLPIIGLLLIAGQRCLVMGGLVLQAEPHSSARSNLRWVLRSDIVNFASAAIAAYAVVVL